MRDYQRTKNNKYLLPTAVYHAVIWQVRDYYRMKDEADAIIESSPPPSDGMPKGTAVGDQVLNKALRRAEYVEKIKEIDAALEDVPKEYRRGVWHNIQWRDPFPLDADRSTYARWKSRFLMDVAYRLGLL